MKDFTDPVIAVVGVAKNCGKTTTLNCLATKARNAGRVVGLVSVGIDGESRDVLVGTPKPPIAVHHGQLVATTRQMLKASSADMEYLEPLGFTTPLGEAVLARAVSEGEVVLGGMRHRADVAAAVAAMRAAGADQVLIDGAYGRIMAAHPGLSDGVIVATGAVVGTRIPSIVATTAALIDRLALPEIEEPWQLELMDHALETDRALLGGPSIAPIELPARSALLGLSAGRDRWTPDVEAVAVPGLVSDRVVQELLRRPTPGTLLLNDGTTFQADEKLARKLAGRWQIRVRHACRVLAIAMNPTSLRGHTVDGEQLRDALSHRFPNMTVFDPIVDIH